MAGDLPRRCAISPRRVEPQIIGQVAGRVCGHRYEPNGEDKDQGDAALRPIVDRAAAVSMVWTLHAQLDSRTAPAGLRARADSFTSSPGLRQTARWRRAPTRINDERPPR